MQGGGGGAVKEFYYGGGGGGGQPEIVDGAFLMELLEDTPAADQPPEDVDDRLSRVIRSLEAEIGGGEAPALAPAVGDGESTTDGPTSDDGGLEDMLSDFDSSPDPCSAEAPPPAVAPFEYWAEVPPAMGHDMGGWYVDGDGLVVGYEFREQCYYTYGEGQKFYGADAVHDFAVEQVYSPLWE